RRRVGRAPQQAVHRRVSGLPCDGARLDETDALESTDGSARNGVTRRTVRCEHHYLQRSDGARTRTHNARGRPLDAAVPTFRQLARRTTSRRADHQPPEAALVLAPDELTRVRAPRIGPL